MRFKRKQEKLLEGDLTPMIDMAFQLIAFFVLLINFSKIEKTEEINLPDSTIVQPPDAPPEYDFILNLREDGTVFLRSLQVCDIDSLDQLEPRLQQEISAAARLRVAKNQIQVVIRGDVSARTGDIQRLMNKCKEFQLEVFNLRVRNKSKR